MHPRVRSRRTAARSSMSPTATDVRISGYARSPAATPFGSPTTEKRRRIWRLLLTASRFTLPAPTLPDSASGGLALWVEGPEGFWIAGDGPLRRLTAFISLTRIVTDGHDGYFGQHSRGWRSDGSGRGSSAGAQRPAWSPDGRWLSYSVGGLFAPSNLFIIDVATKAKRQVTHFSRANEGVFDYAWLPGNRHLVVLYVPSAVNLGRDLGLMDVTDGSITRLAMAIRDGLTVPSLSRDGSRLLMTTTRSQSDIRRVPLGPDPDANGRNAIRLRDSVGEPMWTSLSPDRRTVLFSSSITGSRNLWTMPVDASAPPRQITSVPRSTITHSSMSPDGRRVAFASTAAGRSDIWTQNIDGSELRQLTNDQAASSWPVWSPDGKQIVYTSTLPSGRIETKLVPSSGGPSEHLIDGFFRGDWVRRSDGLGTWIVTSNGSTRIRLIDVEKARRDLGRGDPGTGLSLPVFSPDRRSISVPVREDRNRDSIWVLDVASAAEAACRNASVQCALSGGVG